MTSSPVWLYWVLLVISGMLNLTGFFGLFLVFFPGLTVAWIGQLIWVIFVGFNRAHEPWQFGLTIAIFVINTVIMILGSLLDNLLGAGKTREKGVPWSQILLVWLAIMLGGLLLTPLGGLAIGLGLLFVLEYRRLGKDKELAWQSTKAMAFGYGSAAVLRLVLCAVMIVLWVFMVVVL